MKSFLINDKQQNMNNTICNKDNPCISGNILLCHDNGCQRNAVSEVKYSLHEMLDFVNFYTRSVYADGCRKSDMEIFMDWQQKVNTKHRQSGGGSVGKK